MKKLYVIDLSKNYFDIKVEDSEIIYINCGNINNTNSKILKIGDFVKSYNAKKIFLNSLNKKIISKENYFVKELEIFNIRNDKNFFITKILNFLTIKNFINKNQKKYKIHCITDNDLTIDILNQISKTRVYNEYYKKTEKRFSIKNKNLSFFKFILKTFLVISIIKLFNQKCLIKKLKFIKKKWGLSLFPNFYKSKNEIFFGNNFNKINFLFSDETHLNHTFFKILGVYFRNRHKILNMECFINYKDIVFSIIKFYLRNKKYKNFFSDTFFVDKLDFTDFYRASVRNSYINRSKLTIYDEAINRFQKLYGLDEFHLYLFEYNFGFYLIRQFKKNNCKTVGYQHGIFDENLMWLDLIVLNKNEIFFPYKIISNYLPSLKLYKLKYKKNVKKYLYVKKKISQISKNLKVKKTKRKNIKILFVAGTHDIKHIYNYCKNEIYQKKECHFYIKPHPKNKFLFYNEKFLKKIEDINNKSFDKIFISSTSTIGYDLSILRKKFNTFKPDYKSVE